MKFYYVYMLECSDKTIYTGLTNTLERRFKEHAFGLNEECYTYNRRPLKLIFRQEFLQFEQAEMFEKRLKRWSRKKKLALANEDFDLLKDLAVCKNDTHSKNFQKS
ncbi:GIY-YIG nuclease family protein [Winogradskyella maritima]|uniref:GIY-YIG nuclease family protein n=1 Tax=Winogradskyella maritima TaxID=1517766 RepID=A0ABV8ADV6_9FLAO|nr:GIY-YIG nuclease family protein [Winogradskyella maritima]